MTDSVPRFCDKYISEITDHDVPQGARRWYVRHLVLFIQSRAGRWLAATTREDVEVYIDEIGRKEKRVKQTKKPGPIMDPAFLYKYY